MFLCCLQILDCSYLFIDLLVKDYHTFNFVCELFTALFPWLSVIPVRAVNGSYSHF